MTTERAERGRTVVRVVMTFLLGLFWFGPVVEATLTLLFGREWDWGDAFMRGVTFGASMAIVVPVGWWLSNENGERRALRRAITTDGLPADADPGEWEPRLRNEHTRLRVARWLLAGMFGVEAALLVLVVVTTGRSAGGLWLAAGVAAISALVSPLWGSKQRQVIERLRAQLPQP